MESEPEDFLFDGPDNSPHVVVLSNGAGAPMDSPFLNRFAEGLAARGFRVARFEFPYMQARRREGRRTAPDRQPVLREAWLSIIDRLGGGSRLVIGGKSLGGRIASLVADEAGARGLLCLGYPFHPPGQPDRLRTKHLEALRTPGLILQGTRDPFGSPEDVGSYRLSQVIRVRWIPDGDHSFKPRVSSGRTEAQNLEEAIRAAADFCEDPMRDRTNGGTGRGKSARAE
ncbi:MAG TPA: alpha/beta family hydrolase [Thermoanaerobaculia bacterium]|nr:alpha/beta family hydrolase [Thermoanaerobaculia bacterium]